MVKTVGQLLSQKSNNTLISIDADEFVSAAAELMSRYNIGALPVMSHNRIVGLVTERDCLFKSIANGLALEHTLVSEVMDRNVLFVAPENQIDHCMALMTERRERYLVVLELGRAIGMISLGDVIKAMLSERAFVIEQLTRYIAGSYTEEVENIAYEIPPASEFRPEY